MAAVWPLPAMRARVEACTAAGVLVVNQSGGNAHSVAEHALGMLLTLSKRIIEADRALRRDPNVNRNSLIGTEAQGKTIGIVGLGNVGRRIAALCNGLLGMKVSVEDGGSGGDVTHAVVAGFHLVSYPLLARRLFLIA